VRIELDGVPAELVATAARAATRGTVVHYFVVVSSSSVALTEERRKNRVGVFFGRLENNEECDTMRMLLYNNNFGLCLLWSSQKKTMKNARHDANAPL